MSRAIPFTIGLALILASGLAHGVWTGRWRSSAELQAAAAKLANVPMDYGDWQGQDMKMSEYDVKAAGIVGYVNRRYVNKKTGEGVSIMLVCGPPGPISVHSPEVCYPGAGYMPTAERFETKFGEDTFWTIKLSKQTALTRSDLVVNFAWNAKGVWDAPKWDPRMGFAQYSALYKMYIIHEPRGSSDDKSNPSADFAQILLPSLRSILFGNSKS